MTTTTKKAELAERIKRHGAQLLAIFPNATERDPVALCKKLRRLENAAARIALRLCNGPEYPEGEADRLESGIFNKLDELLDWANSGVPVIINRDPRGHSLKIDDEWMRKHRPKLHTDWGGYGILAPEIE
jgi:hypothetical protein